MVNLAFVFALSCEGLDSWRLFFKPLMASVLSVGGAFALYAYLCKILSGSILPFAISLIAAVLLYLMLSLLTGSVTANDLSLLPFCEKLALRVAVRKEKK